ncbi:hypothetical protein OF83DRAFT_387446 [Amylostereum chailletii]|nr:hypothetical protein OF83DRAFT_387446 [Amylostereum chailletii]
MFDLGVAVTNPDLSGVEIAPEAMYSSRREDIFWQDELDWLVSMILFPTEMKKTDQSENLGRLLFDLSTSFHHLTALGLDVSEMYGAVCASGTVDVHVMRKKNLKVHAMSQNALASYDLREALGVLKCYTFRCRLRHHLRSSIVEKFLDLTPEMLLEAINKSDQPWRAPSKVRGEVPPANKDTSGHGANGGGERASGEVGERGQGGEAGGGGSEVKVGKAMTVGNAEKAADSRVRSGWVAQMTTYKVL